MSTNKEMVGKLVVLQWEGFTIVARIKELDGCYPTTAYSVEIDQENNEGCFYCRGKIVKPSIGLPNDCLGYPVKKFEHFISVAHFRQVLSIL